MQDSAHFDTYKFSLDAPIGNTHRSEPDDLSAQMIPIP